MSSVSLDVVTDNGLIYEAKEKDIFKNGTISIETIRAKVDGKFYPVMGSRIEEARECVRLLLAIDPALTIAKYASHVQRHITPAFDAFFVEGLRKAGLPEE